MHKKNNMRKKNLPGVKSMGAEAEFAVTLTLSAVSILNTHKCTTAFCPAASPCSHDLRIRQGKLLHASGCKLFKNKLWIIVPQYESLWLIAWDKSSFSLVLWLRRSLQGPAESPNHNTHRLSESVEI